MEIPWDLFFAVFTCLAAVLFAAAGAVTVSGRWKKLCFPVAGAALASMTLGLIMGAIYLGHPERIFGAFANTNSVLSREVIAVFAGFIAMAIFVYQLRRSGHVPGVFSVLAVLLAIALLVTTVQLIRVWTSDDPAAARLNAGAQHLSAMIDPPDF
jgi:DMSO reductase anchor subunit